MKRRDASKTFSKAQASPTAKAKAPAEWVRKQTVKNAERYITDELKKFEDEALGAHDRSVALEQQLFEKVRQALLPHVGQFQELAGSIARVGSHCHAIFRPSAVQASSRARGMARCATTSAEKSPTRAI